MAQSQSPPHFLPVGPGTGGCEAHALVCRFFGNLVLVWTSGKSFLDVVSTPQPLETGTGQSDCERKIEIQRDWGEEEGLWLPSLGNVSILGLACGSQGCEEPARPHRPSLAVPGDSAPAYTSPGSVGACLPYLPCLPCIQLSTSLLDRWLLSPSCSHSVFLPLFSSTLPPPPLTLC